MRFFLFLLCTLSCALLCAQTPYEVSTISSTLRSRANAIVRHQETLIDMKAKDQVAYYVNQAITVFNKSGENHAMLHLFYDKNTVIKSIKGEIYNEMGVLQTRFTQRDFLDESAVNDFSIYEDNRVKRYMPTVNDYPYTIVYQYELQFKQNLILPSWYPKPADDVAVEKSSFTFICKPGDKFRVQVKNVSGAAVESTNEKQKKLIWTVSQLTAQRSEAFGPALESYIPSVKIAPNDFSYYQYSASYKNWKELGQWIYNDLLKDRGSLPPATAATIKELVRTASDPKEKVRLIYQYLQEKTRYISVQIGIGGFKPFSAADVDRLGYGDCKALVNYMQSLLKVADIESLYCIVNAGDDKKSLDPTFASMNQANHVILCVPLTTDTVWLECTSQKIPFGFLSSFTDNRTVLACAADGGKLLQTPAYTASQNAIQRSASFNLDKDGNLSGKMTTVFKGLRYDDHVDLKGRPFGEQQRLLKQEYPLDHINFSKIVFEEKRLPIPELDEELTIEARNYGVVNQGKLFFSVLPFPARIQLPDLRNRTQPIRIIRGYTYVDEITYTLDPALETSAMPTEKVVKSAFGTYKLQVILKDKVLHVKRNVTLLEGDYPTTSYTEFVNFVNELNGAETLRYILSLK